MNLADLIPHGRGMCFIDKVIDWTDSEIHTLSSSHLRESHPLATANGLISAHSIECAAQAIAIHGAYLGQPGARPRLAIGALKQVEIFSTNLARLTGPLEIAARVEHLAGNGVIYSFSVKHVDSHLARGRITLIKES